MNTLRQDVETILDTIGYNSRGESPNEVFFHEYNICSYLNNELNSAFKTANIEFSCDDSFGGDGKGDDFWSVFKFTRNNEIGYLKFDGWYSSYSGANFRERFWVEPREVTVVQYFKID